MMEKLANDPALWIAVAAFLGLAKVWADAKKAELLARQTNGKVDVVAVGQSGQQQTLVQHTAAIAALQALSGAATVGAGVAATLATPVDSRQATVDSSSPPPPVPPAAPPPPTVPLGTQTVDPLGFQSTTGAG